jgi:hypothetical protein
MLVMSNLRISGCCTPGGSVFMICPMRCWTSNCALSRFVPYWNQAVTSDMPCLLVLSTRSMPGAALTARSMGMVIDFSTSSGPAPV